MNGMIASVIVTAMIDEQEWADPPDIDHDTCAKCGKPVDKAGGYRCGCHKLGISGHETLAWCDEECMTVWHEQPQGGS